MSYELKYTRKTNNNGKIMVQEKLGRFENRRVFQYRINSWNRQRTGSGMTYSYYTTREQEEYNANVPFSSELADFF